MFTSAFLSLALSALTFSQAASATTIKRQTPPTCTTNVIGHLAVRPANDFFHGQTQYVGIVDNVKHVGIDGAQDSIIVSQDDNGRPLGPQDWEFAICTSANGHAPPPGYVSPMPNITSNSFGILRPSRATQHCLAVESEADGVTGARNSILDSYCDQVPEEFRLWMKVSYNDASVANGMPLYFANQNTSVVIGNTAHKELQFFTNTDKEAGEKLQLLLLDPHI